MECLVHSTSLAFGFPHSSWEEQDHDLPWPDTLLGGPHHQLIFTSHKCFLEPQFSGSHLDPNASLLRRCSQ